jgi:hypothetical protein
VKKAYYRGELRKVGGPHYMVDLGQDGYQSPLDPHLKIYGVEPDGCTIFRSAI